MTEQLTEPTAEEEAPQCRFPGCDNPPEPKAPGVTGPAPKYCEREDHNPLTAYRAKGRKPAGDQAAVPAAAEDENRPVTGATKAAAAVGKSIARKIDELRSDLDRHSELLRIATDAEAAEAEVTSIQSDAQQLVADAVKRADSERSQRYAAEAKAKNALEATELAEKAADQAILELEKAEAEFTAETGRITGEADQRVAEAHSLIEEEKAKAAAAVTQAEQDIAAAQAKFTAETERITEEADRRVADAQTAAGKREVEADRKVKEMSKTLEAALKATEEAKEETAAAVKHAAEADATARQIQRDAEGLVAAQKAAGETLKTALTTAQQRVTDLEARIDRLTGEHTKQLNEAHEQTRQARTQYDQEKATADRLTRELATATAEKGKGR